MFDSLGTLLVAAGGSSRLGQPKQLVEYDGEPLVRRQARMLLALDPVCVTVVTGAGAPEVDAALEGLNVDIVPNPDWSLGMGGSIARGAAAMPERVRGMLLLLVDQYRIGRDDLQAIAAAWSDDPAAVALAGWDDQRGPPTLFPRALFGALARLGGDSGARPVLRKFRGRQIVVPTPNAAFDLDTPEDLQRM
ncbi:nucleotidyltransferase family protein [Elongatibacter sediminis]|uniref:Nucleotidyltransferase family protein n=1 Tax=Elongatibacter sediminis TaxID=3119006 RepID=A0AAW9RGS3_9GAMM